MSILAKLESNGNEGRNEWTHLQELTLVVMKAEGQERKELAASTRHPASSVTYKLGKLKDLIKSENCQSDEDLVQAIYRKHKVEFTDMDSAVAAAKEYAAESASVAAAS